MAEYSDKALTIIKENTSALREFNRLKKYELKSKAEAWVSPGELKLRTVWKSESQVIKARERGSVHFKISSSGERDRHLYDLASVNELFLDKSFNIGEKIDGSWNVGKPPTDNDNVPIIEKEVKKEEIIYENVSLPKWVKLSVFMDLTVFKNSGLVSFARDCGFVSFEIKTSAHRLHYRYDMATVNEIFLDKSVKTNAKPFFSGVEPQHVEYTKNSYLDYLKKRHVWEG